MKKKKTLTKREELTIWIGGRLRQARERDKNKSQSKVGSTGIVSQPELSKIESGNRGIDFLVLLQLAKYYKKDLRYFVPDEYQSLFARHDQLQTFVDGLNGK